MPEIFVDDRNFETYKQCEIRSLSERGYYFDVLWIKHTLARKGSDLADRSGRIWTVHEVWGTKKLPGSRAEFKAVQS